MSRYDPKFNISPEEQALTEQLEIKLAMEDAKLARLKKETAPLLAASKPYVRYKDLRRPGPKNGSGFMCVTVPSLKSLRPRPSKNNMIGICRCWWTLRLSVIFVRK